MKQIIIDLTLNIIAFTAIFLFTLITIGCASKKQIIDDNAHVVIEYREPGIFTDGYVLLKICDKPTQVCQFPILANNPLSESYASALGGATSGMANAFIIGGALRDSKSSNTNNAAANSSAHSKSEINIGAGE